METSPVLRAVFSSQLQHMVGWNAQVEYPEYHSFVGVLALGQSMSYVL